MWWLRDARYHKMLCFWGLTGVERQAYIRSVGRVAGRTRKAPKRPAEIWSTRRRKTLVGGTSTEHSQLSSAPPEPAARGPGRRPDRGGRGAGQGERCMGRRQTGGRRPRCEDSSRPPLRAVRVLRGARPPEARIEARAESTPPHTTTPRNHATQRSHAITPPPSYSGHRDERTNWQSPERCRK
jgi:hypothetical protein